MGSVRVEQAIETVRLVDDGFLAPCQPLLKWPGGKRSEMPIIAPRIPKHKRYFEPFFGGGSVYFDTITASLSYANDSHADLMMFYHCVKQQSVDFFDVLFRFVEEWERATIEDRNALYYCLRNRYNSSNGSVSCRAAEFFLLRELAYGGMFRVNGNGEFNVPFGRQYAAKNLRAKVCYLQSGAVISKMRQLQLSTKDYAEFLSGFKFDKDDFVFLDPPYDTSFSQYDQTDFNADDQRELAHILYGLKARFMLVSKLTPLISQLYLELKRLFVYRYEYKYKFNIKGRFSRQSSHVLITNYDPYI